MPQFCPFTRVYALFLVSFWSASAHDAGARSYFYQVLFGLILIGNEIPIPQINRHFPTLQHYDGKGFFLIFISTCVAPLPARSGAASLSAAVLPAPCCQTARGARPLRPLLALALGRSGY